MLAPCTGPPASLCLALVGGGATSPAGAEALPEALTLLGGHALPVLGHATADPGAMGAAEEGSRRP
jgi:hypothetical protein